MQVIGAALGIDWKLRGKQAETVPALHGPPPALPAQTIAEVAAAAPKPGADLTETSAAILRQMGIG